MNTLYSLKKDYVKRLGSKKYGSERQFLAAAGVDKSSLSPSKSGNVTWRTISHMTDALGVSAGELYSGCFQTNHGGRQPKDTVPATKLVEPSASVKTIKIDWNVEQLKPILDAFLEALGKKPQNSQETKKAEADEQIVFGRMDTMEEKLAFVEGIRYLLIVSKIGTRDFCFAHKLPLPLVVGWLKGTKLPTRDWGLKTAKCFGETLINIQKKGYKVIHPDWVDPNGGVNHA